MPVGVNSCAEGLAVVPSKVDYVSVFIELCYTLFERASNAISAFYLFID